MTHLVPSDQVYLQAQAFTFAIANEQAVVKFMESIWGQCVKAFVSGIQRTSTAKHHLRTAISVVPLGTEPC